MHTSRNRAMVFLLFLSTFSFEPSLAQYWNRNTQLLPFRMVPAVSKIERIDLDNDGDPDLLKAMINDSIPIIWIDDDDDMQQDQTEGDTDSDCLLIDRNRDRIFAGPWDLSIDWCDTNLDGKADIQLVVNNAGIKVRNFYDWAADYMFVLDDDHDEIMHYIDWNKIMMQAWEHSGQSNFFKDYSGNSTFLKMHASSFRIGDLRYNWENPFIFYDTNKDGLTDWAIRLVDSPVFRDKLDSSKNGFEQQDKEIDVLFTKKIDYAAMTWDLDRDNGPGNEFDFDMSLLFRGKGFDYSDQEHQLKHWKGLSAANHLLFDQRWRELDRLYYPARDTAYPLIFKRGDWQECRLVFDEDDDCNRWERVEFYEPKDLFVVGMERGGLDNNKQADAAGDRGEFDSDNSGKGKLYIGGFDGKIHLYGAEWGAWRIDQLAYSYQGFGGNYERWGRERLQREPKGFATVKYSDANKNGFFDCIEYDLDGDRQFEQRVSLLELGLDDRVRLFNTDTASYDGYTKLFAAAADWNWKRATEALLVAQKFNINTSWYSFYKHPVSLQQKYDYGYWLGFYLYQDIRYHAFVKGNHALVNAVDKAYYSGNWALVAIQ